MSKKHFIEIANKISLTVAAFKGSPEGTASLRQMVDRLCESFVAENPRFDRSRFVTACGLGN